MSASSFERKLRHGIAAAVHITSAFFILGYGISKSKRVSDYNVKVMPGNTATRWKFKCFDRDTLTYVNTTDCSDDDKAFFSEHFGSSKEIGNFNILIAAFLFALWSGIGHLVALFVIHRVDKTESARYQRLIRWADYSVSAPLMLAVVGALYGAPNVNSVIIAPVVLAVLMVLGAVLDPVAHPIAAGNHAGLALLTVAALILLYFGTWYPTYNGLENARKPSKDDVGQAPAFVETIFFITFAWFFTFPFVYVCDAIWAIAVTKKTKSSKKKSKKKNMPWQASESAYIALSMTAKVTLHVFLALTIIAQTEMIGSGVPKDGEEPKRPTVGDIWIGFSAVVAGAAFIHFLGVPLIVRCHRHS